MCLPPSPFKLKLKKKYFPDNIFCRKMTQKFNQPWGKVSSNDLADNLRLFYTTTQTRKLVTKLNALLSCYYLLPWGVFPSQFLLSYYPFLLPSTTSPTRVVYYSYLLLILHNWHHVSLFFTSFMFFTITKFSSPL